jgi:hypothetical protein
MDKKIRQKLRKKFEEENAPEKKIPKLKLKGQKKARSPSFTREEGGNKIYTCHVLGCGKTF